MTRAGEQDELPLPRSVAPPDQPRTPWVWDDAAGLGTALLDSAPLAVLLFDLELNIRAFNRAAERISGRAAADVLGAPATVLVPPGREHVTLGRIVEALEVSAETPQHLELEIAHADGRAVPIGVSFSPLLVDGALAGTVAIARDISDQLLLRRELEDLAAGFQALSDASDLGVYRFTNEPVPAVLHVNRTFTIGTGLDLADFQHDPRRVMRQLPPEAYQQLLANRADPDAAEWPIEYLFPGPDGAPRWLSLFEVLDRAEDGRTIGGVGIVRDVTAVRRREDALRTALQREREAADEQRRAAAELRRVDDLRRLFLQAVSHELRTPLTAVQGFVQTLEERRSQLGEDAIDLLLARTRVQAQRLGRLLDDLLDVERLSRGVLALERRRVDAAELVRAAVTDEAAGCSDDARVVLDVPVEPVPADVDPSLLERIVGNLVGNACKHGGDGVEVTVAVRGDGSHGVRLTVSDDGPGVPDAHKQRVFGLFEQAATAASAHAPGTGVGLALVASLAELHGGRAWLEDAPTGGARVVVELPGG